MDETLTLPANLALAAGFGPNEDLTPDQIRQDRTKAATDAAGMNIQAQQALNPLSPESQLMEGSNIGLQPDPASPPLKPSAPANPQPPKSWYSSAQDTGLPENTPHPLLTDPRFHQALHDNQKAAISMYERVTGRDFKSDYNLYASNQKSQINIAKSTVQKLVESGLQFNQITGEPELSKEVNNPAHAIDPRQPETTTITTPVRGTEKQILFQNYKNLTGFDIPQGMDVPEGLDATEATAFRQKVKEYVDNDTSKRSMDDKIQTAKNKVHAEGWNAQQQATAVASNPAVKISNFLSGSIASYSNLVTRSLARGANLLSGLGNVTMQAGGTGSSNTFPYMKPPLLNGSDVQKAFPPIEAAAAATGKSVGTWWNRNISDPAKWGESQP